MKIQIQDSRSSIKESGFRNQDSNSSFKRRHSRLKIHDSGSRFGFNIQESNPGIKFRTHYAGFMSQVPGTRIQIQASKGRIHEPGFSIQDAAFKIRM